MPIFPCHRLFRAGNFCPVCLKVYRNDESDLPMVCCDMCDRWIHTGLSDFCLFVCLFVVVAVVVVVVLTFTLLLTAFCNVINSPREKKYIVIRCLITT